MEKKYLVVECNELGDQFECDANRTPICITDDYSKYDKMGYEIYEMQNDGTLKLIREYNEVSEVSIVLTIWNDNLESPISVTILRKRGKDSVTKDLVKRIKNVYGFSATEQEIFDDIQDCTSSHGEEINGVYVTFGMKYDDYICKGF